MARPVVLVHGWGGSFEATWQRNGFTELLRDAKRPVIGVDLLGHGTAPKPHDPEAYTDLTQRIVDQLPAGSGEHDDAAVDAIGFSLGAMTLLRLAAREPRRFRKLVVAGVGRNVVEPDDKGIDGILAAIEGRGDGSDTGSQVFAQYAHQPGNDPAALAAIMRRPRQPFFADELAGVTCSTLVVIGDKDFAGPGEPLVAALPNAQLTTLRNVDHFATTDAFGFIDAALEFIDAVPL
jgi:pimeloyl-ACP methyl ester carboxylesterase